MLFASTATLVSLLTLASCLPSSPESPNLAERQNPLPTCTNGGTPLCCQGTFAGDLPLIVTLAGLTNFPLNPNDVNCIGTSPASTSCVGVNTCCQVTGLASLGPLSALELGVGLYCQKPANC